MTQLPAKSLPRIGRRSGQGEVYDPLYPSYPAADKMDPAYFNKEKITGDPAGLFLSGSESIPYPFQGNEHSSPYALMLFKRLLKEGAFRPEEPTGIYWRKCNTSNICNFHINGREYSVNGSSA